MDDFRGKFIHNEAWEEGQNEMNRNEIDFKVQEANNYACNCHKLLFASGNDFIPIFNMKKLFTKVLNSEMSYTIYDIPHA